MRKSCMAALIMFTFLRAAIADQTSNYEIRAVPTPGKVVIDGELSDWDLSGGILMCYDTETLLATNSVRAYLMYDSTWLYAAFRFKDRTPMFNRVNPKLEPGYGWRSDCVQLRFWTDHDKRIGPGGSLLTHIDCYYFTDERRPTCWINYGDNAKGDAGVEFRELEAIGRGVTAAFRKDADGKGYVQEMRIEWSKIRRPPRLGPQKQDSISAPYGFIAPAAVGRPCSSPSTASASSSSITRSFSHPTQARPGRPS